MSSTFLIEENIETVFSLLTDPDFLVDRSLAVGELSAEVEVEELGAITTIIMTREVERELPKFLAKLFNTKQVLHVKETWQPEGDCYKGKSVFTVEGQPVKVDTTMTLKPQGEHCEFSISYKAKANIPLVGGKVEKFIISNCEEGTAKEIDFLKQQLTTV